MTTLFSLRRFPVALAVLVVAVWLAPGTIFARSSFDAAQKKAPLRKVTFTPKLLAFSRVRAGTSRQMSVSLTNAGTAAIKITKITTSGAGFSADQNCVGTLAAAGDACAVVVTFAPKTEKSAKGTKVTGTLTIKDNDPNSPHKVALSAVKFGPADAGDATPTPTSGSTAGSGEATPTPTPSDAPTPTPTSTAGSGTPFAIQAAGIYVFNSGQGVASPQIVEYSTDPSTGETSQSGSVAAGAGLLALTFTPGGQYAYGFDSAGNVWGYAVSSTAALTSVGSPAAPPVGGGPFTWLQTYGSSMLWAVNQSGADNSVSPITVVQYPINSDGTLASPTTVTLTGGNIEPFTPPGSSLPTAVWAFWNNDEAGILLSTLNVYPVNSDGTINGTSIQSITAPNRLVEATTGAFAFGVGQPNPPPLQPSPPTPPTQPLPQPLPSPALYIFSLGSDGTLTANPTVSLPETDGFWGPANPLAPGIGSTIYLTDYSSLLVYPVSSDGVVGTILQDTMLAGLPQFPLS